MLLGSPTELLLDSWHAHLYPWHSLISSPNRAYGLSFDIGNLMSVEELVSLQFGHLKHIIEKQLGNQVYDCLLVVRYFMHLIRCPLHPMGH